MIETVAVLGLVVAWWRLLRPRRPEAQPPLALNETELERFKERHGA